MNRRAVLAVLALAVFLSGQFAPTSFGAAGNIPSVAASVVLTIVPPKLPSDGGSYAAVVVSLADAGGLPSAALVDTTVFLSSSQTNIASVPDSVVIAPGQEYAVANVTTTTTPGSAMITAHAEGLGSPPPLALDTITPSGFPSKLKVFASPEEFLPRSDSGSVRVEVVDDAGLPSKALSSITVQITSSNSSVVNLDQSTLTIAAGSLYSTGTFHTSQPGPAVISAASTGYASDTTLVTVDKPAICITNCGPYKLGMRMVPKVLQTDGATYTALEVALETQGGTPAVSSTDTIVQLTSDKSEVASVPGLITIPAGAISTLAQVTTSALAGTANVTATATGLVPSTVAIQTIIPAPSKLQAYIAPPSSAFSTNGNYPILVVQLQDSAGNPARARQTASITVTSSNGSLLSSFVSLSIPVGKDYVFAFLHTKGVGMSTLTVSSQGLLSSNVDLQSFPNPLVAKLTLTSTSNSFIFSNQTATYLLTMTFLGQPVQNVNVTWGATGGAAMTPAVGSTGTSGQATSVFSPASFGSYNITASASTPQTGPILVFAPLLVVQVPPKAPLSLVGQILSYWYYIVAAVVVVAIAVSYLFRMRRKKQRAEIEAGFEVV